MTGTLYPHQSIVFWFVVGGIITFLVIFAGTYTPLSPFGVNPCVLSKVFEVLTVVGCGSMLFAAVLFAIPKEKRKCFLHCKRRLAK